MGIHSGPVNEVTDLNEQANIAGAGINIAQRVMDCGDAGHILLSHHVADDLGALLHDGAVLHELGECEVKHGLRISLLNFTIDDTGQSGTAGKISTGKSEGTNNTGGCASQIRRGAAVRQHERRQKRRVFERRDDRGTN